MKKVVDYMEKHEVEKTLVQAMIPKKLHQEVRDRLDYLKMGWSDLFTAACKRFVEEMKAEEAKK